MIPLMKMDFNDINLQNDQNLEIFRYNQRSFLYQNISEDFNKLF